VTAPAQNIVGSGDPSRRVRSVAGREIVFDGEGFLSDPDDWTEELALALARESGLDDLDPTQWRVINVFREYYYHHGRAPLNRQLKAECGLSLMELEGLFPGGLKYGARRLAGLPNPKTCS